MRLPFVVKVPVNAETGKVKYEAAFFRWRGRPFLEGPGRSVFEAGVGRKQRPVVFQQRERASAKSPHSEDRRECSEGVSRLFSGTWVPASR